MIVRTQDKEMHTKTSKHQYIMFIFLEPELKKYRIYNRVILRIHVNKAIYNTFEKLIKYIKTYTKEYKVDTIDLKSEYFKEEITKYYNTIL
jgi:Ni,Fe-hydrogenase I large subunit